MQLPENQTPETEVSADITPTDVKENNKKKAKRLLIFLGIALVVLLLLNLIPFDKLTELALNQIPEETEPAVTYADEFFVPPDYNEDVLQDEIYTKFNLDMTFTREGESFGITQANADDYGAVCHMFYNYFEYLKAGDTDACNALFTDEYFAENDKFNFAPQKVYDMTVSVVRSEFLLNGDAKGNYKGYTVSYCEVAYKIYQNNGTLRRDFYEDNVTLPLIFEVLEKNDEASINQIMAIRNSQPQESKGGPIIMYVIWIAIIALAIFLEANTASLTAIWFIPAALVSLIMALCNATWQAQSVTFAILALIFVLIGTTMIRKRVVKKKHVPTNTDRIIGGEGLVTEEINNSIPTGEVKTDGKRWSARSADGSIIEEGAMVTVLRIEGVKLIVEKKN